ncbi:RNA pseudouridine synthase [Alteribacter lacisalsi]|uniref:Pseudouridine synthase n=1 Tax=Alteribacter lacisalsi TaxID=2045244 RepID=A0A2W0HLJ7_9BACI|nr:RluA family pseudouridine synthase [Alteribacter lacisalsi]PYZ97739.1 RNA pseudouridine synthase [Alteribacter lacisalsi]
MTDRLCAEWTVPPRINGVLLKEFLRTGCKMSRKTLAEIKHSGGSLLVNGTERTVRFPVYEGDLVTVFFAPEIPSPGIEALDMPLNIVYEDEHVLLLNKPPGLATVPSPDDPGRSLAGAVIGYFRKESIPSTFHAVSRLDRDTSGLLAAAKHRYAHHRLSESGTVRSYLAIVQGNLKESTGTINSPIVRKEGSIIERTTAAQGKRAVTHYRCIEEKAGISLVSIRLETGRTHQIRVHFASIGHPLAGDTLYGTDSSLISRHALHAYELAFTHPITEDTCQFTCAMPDDMRRAWEKA